jgi:hypothetical protein
MSDGTWEAAMTHLAFAQRDFMNGDATGKERPTGASRRTQERDAAVVRNSRPVSQRIPPYLRLAHLG